MYKGVISAALTLFASIFSERKSECLSAPQCAPQACKLLSLPALPCCAVQWGYKVWKSQYVLGSLYERIYDTMRARGVPPAEETVLWACLARLKDPTTGVGRG
mgnify:CR=1 FL=1